MAYSQEDTKKFRDAADQIRSGKHLGRSDTLYRIFEYLLECSLVGRSPKEAEIAHSALGRPDGFDAVQDASVRVSIHRLRKKLEDYYRGPGATAEARIVMPRGQYRFDLVTHAEKPGASFADVLRKPQWIAAFAVLLFFAIAAFSVLRVDKGPDAPRVTRSILWDRLVKSPKPIIIVLGDYYIFGEKDRSGSVARLVREYRITSRADLDERIMADPALGGRYVDLGLRYYPVAVGMALRDLLPVLITPGHPGGAVRVMPSSDLTVDVIRENNIVYIGYFSGLGMLRNPVFNGSRFAIGSSYDQLIDKAKGRFLVATAGDESGTPQQDFGYVARIPGPADTSIVVIAGTRDAAVMQAARFATTQTSLDLLERRAGGAAAFEAMLQVDSLNDQNLAGRLKSVSLIDTRATWRLSAPQDFPDDPQASGETQEAR